MNLPMRRIPSYPEWQSRAFSSHRRRWPGVIRRGSVGCLSDTPTGWVASPPVPSLCRAPASPAYSAKTAVVRRGEVSWPSASVSVWSPNSVRRARPPPELQSGWSLVVQVPTGADPPTMRARTKTQATDLPAGFRALRAQCCYYSCAVVHLTESNLGTQDCEHTKAPPSNE